MVTYSRFSMNTAKMHRLAFSFSSNPLCFSPQTFNLFFPPKKQRCSLCSYRPLTQGKPVTFATDETKRGHSHGPFSPGTSSTRHAAQKGETPAMHHTQSGSVACYSFCMIYCPLLPFFFCRSCSNGCNYCWEWLWWSWWWGSGAKDMLYRASKVSL